MSPFALVACRLLCTNSCFQQCFWLCSLMEIDKTKLRLFECIIMAIPLKGTSPSAHGKKSSGTLIKRINKIVLFLVSCTLHSRLTISSLSLCSNMKITCHFILFTFTNISYLFFFFNLNKKKPMADRKKNNFFSLLELFVMSFILVM